MEYSQEVRQSFLIRLREGSIPSIPVKFNCKEESPIKNK